MDECAHFGSIDRVGRPFLDIVLVKMVVAPNAVVNDFVWDEVWICKIRVRRFYWRAF